MINIISKWIPCLSSKDSVESHTLIPLKLINSSHKDELILAGIKIHIQVHPLLIFQRLPRV